MSKDSNLISRDRKIYTVGETYIHLNLKFSSDIVESLQYELKNEFPILFEQLGHSKGFEVEGLVIEFDEGSIKLRNKIMGGLVAIYFGIGHYGDFRSGVDQIIKDLQSVSEFTKEYLEENTNLIQDQNIIRYERRLGVTGRIQRSISRIDHLLNNRNDIPPNEFNNELENIKQYLANTLPLLNPQEKQLILNNLPNEVQNNMPNPEIPKVDSLYSRYALKPEDELVEINE